MQFPGDRTLRDVRTGLKAPWGRGEQRRASRRATRNGVTGEAGEGVAQVGGRVGSEDQVAWGLQVTVSQ